MVCPTGRQGAEDAGDAGDADGEIVVAEEGGATTFAGAGEEIGVGGEAFEEGDEGRGIAGIDLPQLKR